MSCLITSVNSVRPSPVAPADASVRSCARRASDSIIRSSTTWRAQVSAFVWVIVESNAVTLSGNVTGGIGGRNHTLDDAWVGVVPPGGGNAWPAALTDHDPMSRAFAPMTNVSVGSWTGNAGGQALPPPGGTTPTQ